MGAALAGEGSIEDTRTATVTLHCYDFLSSGEGQVLNGILRQLGTGAFHCGVEVYGKEWSFRSGRPAGVSGLFWVAPRTAGGAYRETIVMGETSMSEKEVERLVQALLGYWPSSGYDLLMRNCCHFSNEFCQRLGVGSIPEWTMTLAKRVRRSQTGQRVPISFRGGPPARASRRRRLQSSRGLGSNLVRATAH